MPQLADGPLRLGRLASDRDWTVLDVERASPLTLENGIVGHTVVLKQLQAAADLIRERQPERLFTLGGECSTELMPVTYLNQRFPDLCLVWIDAHPDLCTPDTSASHNFHGMPLQHLLGAGAPEVLAHLPSTLRPQQVVMAGVRELDPPEQEIVDAHGIVNITADELNSAPHALGDLLASRGVRRLYLHVDFDGLEPTEFGAIGWPTPHGVQVKALLAVLADLHTRFEVVGGGLTEYLPHGQADEETARRVLSAWLPAR